MEKKRILIAEDEVIVAESIKNTLNILGYEVSAVVHSGLDAVRKAWECKPDLAIMDIVLKGETDGIEAASKIRSQLNIPVVFLTAYADKKLMDRAKTTEPFGYIIKPFEDRELQSAIEIAFYKYRMEAKLRESERLFREMVEKAGVAILADDEAGNVQYANKKAARLYGYSLREVKKQSVETLVHPDDVARIRKYHSLRLQGKKAPLNYEFKGIKKDGSIIHIAASITLLKKGRKITGTRIYLKDITAQKQSEEALKLSEAKYRTLFESTADPITIIDQETHRFLDCNQAMLRRYGYTLEELRSMTPHQLHPAEEFGKVSKNIDDKDDIIPHRYTHLTKSGETLKVEIHSAFLQLQNREAQVSIIRDVTRHVKAEEELSRSEEAYRQLFEQSVDSIIIISDGRIQKANQAFFSFHGLPPERVIGRNPLHLLHPDDQKRAGRRIQAILSGKAVPETQVYRILRGDGTIRYGEVLSKKIIWEGKPALQSIIRDITQKKRTERVQSSIYKISEFARTSETLDELYRSIHSEISDLIPARDNFYIALHDETSQTLTFPYFIDEKEENPGLLKLGRGLTEYVLRTGKPLLASPQVFKELLQKKEIESVGPPSIDWLGVPLKTKDRIFGVLAVQSYTKGVRFTEEDKLMLMYISVQIGMAIQQRKAEETIKESEQRYRDIVDKAGLAISIDDREGNVTYLNEKYSELLGYAPDEAQIKTITDLVHPDDIDMVLTLHKDRILGKDVPSRYEYRGIKKDGSPIYFEIDVVPLEKNGQITGTKSYIWDISDRKQAEMAIKESEERYRDLVEKAGIAITVDDKKGNIKFFNEKFLDLVGYTKDEMKKRSLQSIVHPADIKKVMGHHLNRIQGKRPPSRYEFRALRKDRSVIHLEADAAPLEEAGKIVGTRTYLWDITKRKKAEDEIRSSREQLRNLAAHLQSVREEERTKVAQEIHDELGQFLTALKMDISWLNKKLPPEEEKLHDKTQDMLKITDKTIKTIKKLIMELRPGMLDDLDLEAAMEWQIGEIQKRSGLKCSLAVELKDSILSPQHTTAFFRIFQETLTNVVRHALASRVDVSLRKKDGWIELVVTDDGKGITNKQINDSKSYGIIGIKERTQYLGGQFSIKGQAGKGTTVDIKIPIEKAEISNKKPSH